jgi:hypothetical protein
MTIFELSSLTKLKIANEINTKISEYSNIACPVLSFNRALKKFTFFVDTNIPLPSFLL